MPAAPTDAAIRRAVGESAFKKAQAYQRQGKVLKVRLRDNELLSEVAGTELYEQVVTLHAFAETEFDGECSCPVGANCKHVAAAVLEARVRGLFRGGARPVSFAPTERRLAASGQRQASPGLDPHLEAWLSGLEAAETPAKQDYESDYGQRLFYVLGEGPRAFQYIAGFPSLSVRSARLSKSGKLTVSQSEFRPEILKTPTPPKFLLESDYRILRDAKRLASDVSGTIDDALVAEDGFALLADILATGRARWGEVEGPALELGPERAATIEWQAADDGLKLRPTLRLTEEEGHGPAGARDGLHLLPARPPIYIDAESGLVGRLDTGLSPRLAFRVLQAPAVTLEQAPLLAAKMETAGPSLARIARPAVGKTKTIDTPPVPLLKLSQQTIDIFGAPGFPSWMRSLASIGRADLAFLYDGIEIASQTPDETVTRLKGMQPVRIHRDRRAEKAALKRLSDLGFEPLHRTNGARLSGSRQALGLDSAAEWCEFLYEDAPALRADGWAITIAKDFPYQIVRGDRAFDVDIRESSGIDWFEFDLGVTIDGERIDLIGPLVEMIDTIEGSGDLVAAIAAEDGVISVRLDETRYLTVPAARLKPYIDMLQQLLSGFAFAKPGERLRFSGLDAAELGRLEAETAGTDTVWRGGDKVRALGARLKETGTIPDVALPETFHAVLRPYQMRGLAWLNFLREAGLGGILADDMGLGKTLQTLALLAREKAEGRLTSPALVVAPTSLMANWAREAERFVPSFKVLVLQGLDRHGKFDDIDGADLVLTTYPLIRRDHEVLKSREWHLLVLDEAQAIKNPAAETTKLIHGLQAHHRFCLTGTPLENHLGELWSLFQFIAPGFLGDGKSFAKIWRRPIEKEGDAAKSKALAARVRPFLLRRRKDEVALDLPAKTEIVERIDLTKRQSEIYESIRLSMHDKVFKALADKGLARSRIIVLDALLKLRQACCDPRLLKLAAKTTEKAGSAKLERLMEMVTELREADRRIIVFSQFTTMLDLIRERLDAQGFAYSLLTGKTKDRPSEINAFQDGAVPLFLVSLKAGGVGLNLTAADTVILYDPWWNPAVEDQAVDRAHRIGQDKPVFVHKLVATGTIEEKIEVLKQRKAALAANLFDPEGGPAEAMTEEDLKVLFEA